MTYIPISCSIHDRLEAAATLRHPVTLSYAAPDGDVEVTGETIEDVFTHEGAEYLRLSSGLELRLDLLRSVNGMSVGHVPGS
jgi:Rho-binding antiterminator